MTIQSVVLLILLQLKLNSAYQLADVAAIQRELANAGRFLSSISFNSSTATALVSIGALSLLLVATGLYLFNYYSTAARSDSVPQYDPYGNYNPSFNYNKRYFNLRMKHILELDSITYKQRFLEMSPLPKNS